MGTNASSPSDSEKSGKRTIGRVVYHGTTSWRADSIEAEGIRPSDDGLLGKGVYVTTDIDKAWREAEKKIREDGLAGSRPTVLLYICRMGKVKTIDSIYHPMGTTWHTLHNYDTAWIPAGVTKRGSPENCVFNPSRLSLLGRHHSRNDYTDFVIGK
eukprot:m.87631 g.87631  ORF g.87631 m.87631 type:complete len:156 (+) comp36548_c0_seq4:154-621(+)